MAKKRIAKELEKSLREAVKMEHPPKKAYIQSGYIFIGDPSYMAGPAEYAAVAPGKLSSRELTGAVAVDVTPEDPYNPFRKWNDFAGKIGETDAVLPFPGGNGEGRGVVISTSHLSGSFTVERIEDETGKLKELRIVFKD